MIYLTHLPSLARPAPTRVPFLTWLVVLAVPLLVLAISTPYRAALTQPFGPPAAVARSLEHERLQGLVDALRDEGAMTDMKPCHGSELCVSVTDLFRRLDAGDRRSIGEGLRRYFEARPDAASRLVAAVRFIDAQTGVELGRFADHRLTWTDSVIQ